MPTREAQNYRALSAPRRAIESVIALLIFHYGAMTLAFFDDHNDPLYWMGGDKADHYLFSWVLIFIAILHGVGVRMNGRWRNGLYSTALRTIAMGMLTVVLGYMAYLGWPTSAYSAYSTYVIASSYGTWTAARDFNAARKGLRYA